MDFNTGLLQLLGSSMNYRFNDVNLYSSYDICRSARASYVVNVSSKQPQIVDCYLLKSPTDFKSKIRSSKTKRGTYTFQSF